MLTVSLSDTALTCAIPAASSAVKVAVANPFVVSLFMVLDPTLPKSVLKVTGVLSGIWPLSGFKGVGVVPSKALLKLAVRVEVSPCWIVVGLAWRVMYNHGV